MPPELPRIVLICHDDSKIGMPLLTRWIASFATLAGLVIIQESAPAMRWARTKAEWRRSGFLGLLNVLAFRLYYRLRMARRDAAIQSKLIDRIAAGLPPRPSSVPEIRTSDPNSPEVERFLQQVAPDMAIAYCKRLLKRHIHSIPKHGTFVVHPGKCPEYRNSHGCFWALANGDSDKVSLSLLKIDDGVDTGPVYGFFSYKFDPIAESHFTIQHRVLLENLGAVGRKLLDIFNGVATPLSTEGAPSAVWGQPHLTAYLRYRSRYAKRRQEPT